jgi:predicted dehydrogenase
MTQPLRIGFLGVGGIAQSHARHLKKIDGIQLVAACGRDRAKAAAFCAASLDQGATAYDDFAAMLKAEELDAAYLCLPPGAYEGEGVLAARAGVHLMIEKPIALDVAKAEAIAEAVSLAGVQCAIGHHMRHTEPVIKLAGWLADGTAGKCLFMQGHFYVNGLFPVWWRDPNLGGGQMIEQAIHIYDMARYLMGDAATISAIADNVAHQRFPDYKVDDMSASVIRFRNGGGAAVCANNLSAAGTGSAGFTIFCEKLSAHFPGPDEGIFTFHRGFKSEELRDHPEAKRTQTIKSTIDCGYEVSRNFIAAIRGTEKTRTTIRDGVEGLRLVLAAAESAKVGGELVRLPT